MFFPVPFFQTRDAPKVLTMFTESFCTGGYDSGWGESPRRKSRRAGLQPTSGNQGSSSGISTDQSPPISSAPSNEPQPLSLPPGLLDQLVARVVDEVTQRLSASEETRTTSITNPTTPSALSELPLVSTSPAPARAVPAPGTSAATTGIVRAIVHGSLNTTQTSLSGEAREPFFSAQRICK